MWKELWVGADRLMNKFPRLFSISANQNALVPEAGFWEGDSWSWDFQWRRPLFVWEENLVTELFGILAYVAMLRGVEDVLLWKHNSFDQYSCKLAFLLLLRLCCSLVEPNRPFLDEFFNKYWNSLIPLKVSAFGWQVILDRGPSRLNLLKRNVIVDAEDAMCVLCNGAFESLNHLIFSVTFLRRYGR